MTPTNGRAARWIETLLGNRFYPAVFQWITAAALVAIIVLLLFGSNNSGQNFGMAFTWTLWWPLLPISFFLAGRFWCAICPFAWVTDLVQRVVGVRLRVPRVLQRAGPWVIAALFLLITYVDETWRLSVDARRTGYLLLALLTAVIFFAAFFERRAFCRHVCFIGGFAANYSRAGILQLRADTDRCHGCRTRGCYNGTETAPGCPLFLVAPNVEDSATCHLCGNCVKACSRDAIRVSFRAPTSELCDVRSPRLPDAVLACVVMGIVLAEHVSLLRLWVPLVEATGALLHVDPYVWYPLVYAVLLGAFVAAPLAGLALAGFLSETLAGQHGRGHVLRNVVAFGYAIIPLALAGHVAHGAFYLLTRSRTVPFALLALAGRFPGAIQAAWLPNRAVFVVQMVMLASGAAASVYVGARIARRRAPRSPLVAFLPHALLALTFFAANACLVVTLLHEKG